MPPSGGISAASNCADGYVESVSTGSSPPDDLIVEAWHRSGLVADAKPPLPLDDAEIIWIDLGKCVRREEIADYVDTLGLPDYQRGMLGHVMSTVGPDDYGADEIAFHSTAATTRLRAIDGPTFVCFMALSADVQPGPWHPPWIVHHKIAVLAGPGWLITHRTRGHAGDGQVVAGGDQFPLRDLRQVVQLHRRRPSRAVPRTDGATGEQYRRSRQ
jgi:hypothetical protein